MTDINTLNLLRHEFELYQAGYHYGLAHVCTNAVAIPPDDAEKLKEFVAKLGEAAEGNRQSAANHLDTAVALRQHAADTASSLRRRLSSAIIGAVNGWRNT